MRALSLYAVLLLACQAHGARAETLTMAADSWCPYNCDAGASQEGAIVEIAEAAFAKHGITVEYINLPWSRAIVDTRGGKYNAIIGASHDDAPDFVFPAEQQAEMVNAFYVKQGNPWRFGGIESLDHVSIGIIADYTYNKNLDPYLKRYTHDMKRVQVISGDNALEVNIKKLLAGRIGAILEAQDVMQYKIEQMKLADKIAEAGVAERTDQDRLYIAFSPAQKESKKYAQILSKEMQAMRKSGELASILSRYGMKDWKR